MGGGGGVGAIRDGYGNLISPRHTQNAGRM